jgi:hypothetical protein
MGLAFMQVVGLSRDVWLRGASRDEPPRILRKFRITPRHAGRPDPHVAVCVLPVRMLCAGSQSNRLPAPRFEYRTVLGLMIGVAGGRARASGDGQEGVNYAPPAPLTDKV